MNDFIKAQYAALKDELELIAGMGVLPVRRLAMTLTTLGEYLSKINAYLAEHPFGDLNEEIEFFKNIKPLFTCEQLCAIELFTVDSNRPVGDMPALKTYYETELAVIHRFLRQYEFLYQYYRHELVELDHLLFVRGERPSSNMVPEPDGADPAFSTSCDKLFAKFAALERLQEYIINELFSIDHPGQDVSNLAGNLPLLKWTGESINLVELAYGIWLTGQVNSGNATIAEIILWMEAHFYIKIGKPYRRWQEIGKRKKFSVTRYIDDMREKVIRKLDDANGV